MTETTVNNLRRGVAAQSAPSSVNNSGENEAWQMEQLTLADMVGPLAHELHNVFNNMVLQAAIVGRSVPEPFREQIGAFRELAFRASKMLSDLDTYRHNVRFPRQPVDLADIVRRVIEKHQERGLAIHYEVQGAPAPVLGNETDVARLTELLVRNAHAAGSPVAVLVVRAEDRIALVVQDRGPDVESDRLYELFQPFAVTRRGQNSLERAACQTIARRLEAKLRATPREGGGVAVTVDFKSATA
jgi:signal transduction histidine kinase